MQMLKFLPLFLILVLTSSCLPKKQRVNPSGGSQEYIQKSDEEWKKELTDLQYDVMRNKGTERAFTGAYWDHHDQGIYYCAGCHQKLFSSTTKFDSGSGWPSFYQPIADSLISVGMDTSFGMMRDEVICRRCGGHLGHVFPDGPEPTGLRYCMNSVSLKFEKVDVPAK